MSERREHPRFACDLDAEVYTDGETLKAQADDVSRGGVCIELPGPLVLGSMIEISLTLILSSQACSEALVLPAQVVWCTPLSESFQIGCKFKRLSSEQSDYLELFLRFLWGQAHAPSSSDGEADGSDPEEDPDSEPFR